MNLINAYDRESQADVDIVATDPRVLTWASFKTRGEDFFRAFDQYSYPESMRDLKFKTTWRGIEEWEGGTFEKLLAAFKSLVKDENVPLLAEDFAHWAKCQAVSFNMKEDLVYVGSDESETAVQNAINKLKNFLALVIQMPRQVTHCIVLQSKTSSRVMYKWMSHVGLSQATEL
ncbi:hypothetical protein ESCO_000882 [Escovopsis weberi]|uniref:Uncharacterized protein n=1 Tax=Escovopsis weberi TaxID=150374 RepID=A0A0M9VTC9_ESCWE|nr:hypothetical protein ESCO_000882 [Escovopsis weberi]